MTVDRRTSSCVAVLLAAALLAAPAASTSAADPGRDQAGRLAELAELRVEQCARSPLAERIFDAAVEVLRAMPTPDPRAAAVNVFLLMRHELGGAAGVRRGPHEWPARTSLACRSVNGCVEAAKVFFALFRAAYPSYKALYLDSFNADCPSGGHAVVEVEDADGKSFIANAASYAGIPSGLIAGPPDFQPVTEEQLGLPVDIKPDLRGRIVQVQDQADFFVSKVDGKYRLERYAYGSVFNERAGETLRFDSLAGVNARLRAFVDGHSRQGITFETLRKAGLILAFDDPAKTRFQYANWCKGGKATHVVYGCRAAATDEDDAEAVEPAMRKRFAETGLADGCDRSHPK